MSVLRHNVYAIIIWDDKTGGYMVYLLKLLLLIVVVGLCLSCQKNSSKTTVKTKTTSNNYIFALSPEYDDVLSFSEGLAAVKLDNKWGFIDIDGKIIIEPKYDYVSSFSDGLAIISGTDENDKYFGFINKKGEVVIEPQFCKADNFFEEHAVTGICDDNNKVDYYTLINKDGKPISDDIFLSANRMSKGLAAVVVEPEAVDFIDKDGTYVLTIEDSKITPDTYFNEDLAPIELYVNEVDSYTGYINNKGNVVIDPEFNNAGTFSNGYANITVFTETPDAQTEVLKQVKRSGFINKNGQYLVDPEKNNIDITWPFREGLARVFANKKYHYVNDKGFKPFEKEFETASDFSEGLAVVKESKDSAYGYINKYGTAVIKPEFEDAKKFKNDLAAVKKDGKWGFIKFTGVSK